MGGVEKKSGNGACENTGGGAEDEPGAGIVCEGQQAFGFIPRQQSLPTKLCRDGCPQRIAAGDTEKECLRPNARKMKQACHRVAKSLPEQSGKSHCGQKLCQHKKGEKGRREACRAQADALSGGVGGVGGENGHSKECRGRKQKRCKTFHAAVYAADVYF